MGSPAYISAMPSVRQGALCFGSLFCFFATWPPVRSPLSLHDALPIFDPAGSALVYCTYLGGSGGTGGGRTEEHTSEPQSPLQLVCRLLLEKKKVPAPNFT